MSPLPNLFGRGRAEPLATARVRAVRAIRVVRRIKCAHHGPHPDEALRARPTSPQLRSGEVASKTLKPHSRMHRGQA